MLDTLSGIEGVLQQFFPGTFGPSATNAGGPQATRVQARAADLENDPLGKTEFNQLLHLTHEAGVSSGFFEYYFLKAADSHPYPLDKVAGGIPKIKSEGISSVAQLRWGLTRFFTDALLYWGDLRGAYRKLRKMAYLEIEDFFSAKRIVLDPMRSGTLEFQPIPVDDRYLCFGVGGKGVLG